eukprot:3150475-Alexandrium_andersonii.AAC.1
MLHLLLVSVDELPVSATRRWRSALPPGCTFPLNSRPAWKGAAQRWALQHSSCLQPAGRCIDGARVAALLPPTAAA